MKNKEEILTKAVSIYAKQHDLSLDAAVSELNKMSEDEINNIFNNMKLFKDGGKLDYLLCLKKGGSIKDCGCGGEVKKGQFGLSDLNDAQVKERTIKQTPDLRDTLVKAYLPDLSGLEQNQHLEITGNDNGRTLKIRTEIDKAGNTNTTGVYKTNLSWLDLLRGRKPMPAEWKPILDRLLNTAPKKK